MPDSPSNRDELIALVRQRHQEASSWVPSGLGSRVDWGAQLQGKPAQLSCRGLSRVLDHAVDDLTITVEAGLSLAELQSTLAEHDQWLPVDWPRGTDPAQPESAGSIGGLVARGLAGGLRQRHLSIRDQLIGIGLLRPDGTHARAGGRVVKNVAGYDLMRLLCGSWGSLALITELTLRVQPVRPAHAALRLRGDLRDLEACRAALMRSSLSPERCDWCGAHDGVFELRLRVSSISDQAVETQLNRLEALAQEHRLSVVRQPGADPRSTAASTDPMAWLVRAVLPPATLHHLLDSTELQDLRGWRWDLAAGAGCGDGWQSAGAETTTGEAVLTLRRRITTLGGTLSVLKQPHNLAGRIPAWTDSPARSVIEAVKHRFDPKAQLCPGRLPGVAG